jgi:hypothetical protein
MMKKQKPKKVASPTLSDGSRALIEAKLVELIRRMDDAGDERDYADALSFQGSSTALLWVLGITSKKAMDEWMDKHDV